MKRSCLFFLFSLVIVFVIGFFIWSQRGAIYDFVSDVERSASAPVPRSFADVVDATDVVDTKTNNVRPADIDEVELEDDGSEPSPTPPGAATPSPQGEGFGVGIAESESDATPLSDSPLSSLPPVFNLAVPFTSQAPYANWDEVHEDTCEEAALYMVDEFYKGTPVGQITAAVAEAELLKIVEFEKVLFGFFESTTAMQIALLAEQMYGYEKAEVVEGPSVEDLKKYIVAGYPVIVPTAGRMLGNPNFTGEGPLYHALVLKGFTETTFVTNDPGTRRGADYQYDFETVMNAMHDWNGGDVENGNKVVIIVYPNSL
jgi:hypothetical protein